MKHPPPIPENESSRLAALRRFEILDTPPEDAFDDFTRIASMLFNVPISLISLIDENRQWFKSRVGLEVTETSRDLAFCGHAILNGHVMVVPDATKDHRFSENPLVTSDPSIRFYAGAPLIDQDGHNLGTLCVIDRFARTLTEKEGLILETLARRVVAQMELLKISRELSTALKEVATLEELIPICANCKSIRDDEGYWNQVEAYFSTRMKLHFTHGVCPDCAMTHYGVDVRELECSPGLLSL